MEISRVGKSVATAATLARAIQEVDTDLLNGFNELYSQSAGGRLAFVPILAEKQGSGPDASDIDGSGGASGTDATDSGHSLPSEWRNVGWC